MPFLNQDAISKIRRDHIYARAGEPVTIIAEHGTVLIVEDKNLQRFPVRRSLVTEDPVSISDQPVQKIDTPVPSQKKTVATKRKMSAPPNQQNLF